MQSRLTALFSAVLVLALCGTGHAQSDDHHHDKDKDKDGHYNTHRDDDDDDCGDGGSGHHGPSAGGSPINAGGLYIVQGAPGRDLSSSFYPTYPIDVLVNDSSCLVQNAPFPSVQGAFTLSPGVYDLKISPANAAAPCTNGFVREVQATVNTGQATYVVAALSMQSKLTTYTFDLKLPAVPPGSAGVVIANAADTPSLDVGGSVSPLGAPGGSLGGGMPPAPSSPTGAASTTLSPGQMIAMTVQAGPFQGAVYYSGTNQIAAGPILDMLQSRSTDVYFIVGSSQTGTLQTIASKIPDVF